MISNEDLCAQNAGNTGWEDCGIDFERIKSILIMPRSLSFDEDDIASDSDLVEALQESTYASKSSRIYPLLDRVVALTNNTGDPTMDTAGYGNTMGVIFGKHNFQMRLDNNGLHLFQQLFKFNNNKGMSFAFIDGAGKLFARKYDTGFKGMNGQVIVNQVIPAVDAAVMTQNISIILDEEDSFMNDAKLFVYPFSSDIILGDLMHGIHDVTLSEGGTHSATAIKVKAMLPANFVDFITLYSSEIANKDAWVVTDTDTGVEETISGVTVSIGVATLAGTFSGSYTVSLVTPAALIALVDGEDETPIGSATTGGYESNTIEVTIPS